VADLLTKPLTAQRRGTLLRSILYNMWKIPDQLASRILRFLRVSLGSLYLISRYMHALSLEWLSLLISSTKCQSRGLFDLYRDEVLTLVPTRGRELFTKFGCSDLMSSLIVFITFCICLIAFLSLLSFNRKYYRCS
jgi:hypothetical protein